MHLCRWWSAGSRIRAAPGFSVSTRRRILRDDIGLVNVSLCAVRCPLCAFRILLLAAAVAMLGFVSACGRNREGSVSAESPVTVTEKWRAKHEADYRRDWATIAGLFPLKEG